LELFAVHADRIFSVDKFKIMSLFTKRLKMASYLITAINDLARQGIAAIAATRSSMSFYTLKKLRT